MPNSDPIDSASFTLIRDFIVSMNEKMDKILDNMVNSDYCKEHRTRCIIDNGDNFKEIYDRLKGCEEQCVVFKNIYPNLPSQADILKARSEAEEKAALASRAEDKVIADHTIALESRLDSIDDKLKIFDVSYWSVCKVKNAIKNNKIIATFVGAVSISIIGVWLTFFGVVLGRIHDYF